MLSRKFHPNKKISVIMPYYRKKKYFRQTINSLSNQTFKNYKLILIYDDQSKSELTFVKKVLKKIKNKKIIINKKNLGAANSRNIALKYINSEFVAFLDADDIWNKKKLEEQLKFMTKKKLDLSYTSYQVIDENNFILKTYYSKSKLSFNDLIKSCDIGLSSVLIKRALLKKFKFPNIKTKEDYVLWLNIAKNNFRIGGLSEVLMQWRSVRGSLSSSLYQKILDAFRVYHTFLKYNFIKSILYTFILSVNYIKKRYL